MIYANALLFISKTQLSFPRFSEFKALLCDRKHLLDLVGHHSAQLPFTDSHDVRSSVRSSTQTMSFPPPPHSKTKFPGVSDTFQNLKKKFMGKMPIVQDDEGKACCNKCRHVRTNSLIFHSVSPNKSNRLLNFFQLSNRFSGFL